MVEAQPLEACLDAVHDVAARRAAIVGARAHAAMHLGRDHHVRALDAQAPQRLAGELLGAALGIDVGGVDEVDAGLERAADDAVDLLLAQLADRLPHARLPAEGHRAEAQLRDEQPAATELVVTHILTPRVADGSLPDT